MNLNRQTECILGKWTRPLDTWLNINTYGNKNMKRSAGKEGICRDMNDVIVMAFHCPVSYITITWQRQRPSLAG